MEAVRRRDRICEAAICYTGDILDPKRDKYTLQYYVRMAKELEKMGAHVLAIKDMAGLCKPYAADGWSRRCARKSASRPFPYARYRRHQLGILLRPRKRESTSPTSRSLLWAAPTSQPNLNSIVAALQHTPRETGLDLALWTKQKLLGSRSRVSTVRSTRVLKSGTAQVYVHEMPGGQYTNLREQAEAMGLGARWPEIARTYADVNMAFGDIVKVTPSSKVVGDLAIFLVSHGMTVEEFKSLGPNHSVTLPNSVADMFSGSLGEPEGGWPKDVEAVVLHGGARQFGTSRRASGSCRSPCDSAAIERKDRP